MDTDNVKHILWINKMFSCGTKRAIPSVSGQDRPVLPPNHITLFTPLAELATYYSFLAV